MRTLVINKKAAKGIPRNPGVYIFHDKKRRPIYVGKAKDLKNRVTSYFAPNLEKKTNLMVSSAHFLSYIPVASELEAILLEVIMVKKYLPKFNSQLRDDKSPLYIGITKEELPRVLTLRKTQLKSVPLKNIYGPFTDSHAVRMVLKLVRRVFPFSRHKPTGRICIYSQIGRCNPCPSEIKIIQDLEQKAHLKHVYLANVKGVKKVLSGRLKLIERDLARQMQEFAAREEYEAAALVKDQLQALNTITVSHIPTDLYLKDPNLLEDIRNRELADLSAKLSKHFKFETLRRIECFDVAHLSGTNPTASMVTFINGEADKSLYRHFRVYARNTKSDTEMIQTIIKRRAKYYESWGIPDLIIIDGGRPQVSAARAVEKTIPVVGLAKRFETLVVKTDEGFETMRLSAGPARNLVTRMRDEAHRFARRHHHALVAKAFKSE